MRAVTFNVLADAYTGYGDYSHVDQDLLETGARIEPTIELLRSMNADIVGLQEADEALMAKIHDAGEWQTFWTPKGNNKPDGCLMLINNNISVASFRSVEYGDGSGHVAQIIKVGELVVANTHLKWAPIDSLDHIGVGQARELVSNIQNDQAVLLADCNDQQGGPVRQVIAEAGFVDLAANIPSALVNQDPVAIDLLAVRGMSAKILTRAYDLRQIPNTECPSDHIPIEAELGLVS